MLIVLLAAAAGLGGCTRGGDRDRVQASIGVSPPAALVDGRRTGPLPLGGPGGCLPSVLAILAGLAWIRRRH